MLNLSGIPKILKELNSLFQVWSYYHVQKQRANEFKSKVKIHFDRHDWHWVSFSWEIDSEDYYLCETCKKASLSHVLVLILLDIRVHHHYDGVCIQVTRKIESDTITAFNFAELSIVLLDNIMGDHLWVIFPLDKGSLCIISWRLRNNSSYRLALPLDRAFHLAEVIGVILNIILSCLFKLSVGITSFELNVVLL